MFSKPSDYLTHSKSANLSNDTEACESPITAEYNASDRSLIQIVCDFDILVRQGLEETRTLNTEQ